MQELKFEIYISEIKDQMLSLIIFLTGQLIRKKKISRFFSSKNIAIYKCISKHLKTTEVIRTFKLIKY